MKLRSKIPQLSISLKIVLSFLLVIIPIYFTSLLMNQSGKELVKKQLTQSLQSQIHFYRLSLDTEISRLITMKAEYVNDNDFQRLATAAELMTDYELLQAIIGAKNKLHLLKSSTPFVENVKMYIPLLNWSINANHLDDNIPLEEIRANIDSSRLDSPIFSFQDRLFISGNYPEVVSPGKMPILSLGIELSANQLRTLLTGIVSGNNGVAVFYSESADWYVSSGPIETIEPMLKELAETRSGHDLSVSEGTGFKWIDTGGKTYFSAYEYSSITKSYMVVYVPIEQVISPLTRYSQWLWVLSLISVVLVAVFSFSIYKVIHKPLHLLVGAFKKVEKGDLHVAIELRRSDEFHYMYRQFNQMVSRIHILIQEVYEQKILTQESQMKQLQAQINPHFLYNSFFILKGLVRRGEQVISLKLLENLGNYFNFITRNASGEIALESEVGHALSYLEIQKLRFSESIETFCDPIPEEWRGVLIPRLILQPLVENAFKYALEDKISGGLLEIKFIKEGSSLIVCVEDNGDGMSDEQLKRLEISLTTPDQKQEITGLLNVHRRLKISCGADSGIQVARSTLGGFSVRFAIPMRKETTNV